MKLTVTLVLLIAAAQAAEVRTARKQKTEDTKTEKRELEEGNAAVAKRAPVLPTVLPPETPGIEYADSKETHREKSPSQQVYASPAPIGKISDLLSGQGPFQTAIASHLFAPVSVYQARLGAPTTYQVSSPIASQLAYSEHKISYQPPQNAIQYQPVQYNQKLQVQKQANFARPINYQQPYQQQIFVQQQPLVYSQPPQHLVPAPQPIQYQHIPFQVQRPLQYTQHTVFPQQFVRQYNQEQQTLVRANAVQPGITYAQEESREDQRQTIQEQATQRQQKVTEQPEEPAKAEAEETQTAAPETNYNRQPQGAVSYASFSQSQPAPSFAQPQRLQSQQHQAQAQPQQYQAQPQQYQVQPQQFQVQPQQYQVQPQQYQVQPQQYQAQPQQYQAQSQQYQANPQQYQAQPQLYQVQQLLSQPQPQQFLRYDLQPQISYQTSQNSPSKDTQETIVTASTKSLPVNPQRQLSYFRPGPVLPQIQPQQYAQQQVLVQNAAHAPQHLGAPSFPPVQYFGKYAQSIFGPH